MKLVIVESPNKCSTISQYLGKGYKVIASKGHIRDLSTKGKGGLGIDVEHDFTPDFIIPKGKLPTVKMLKSEAAKADEVILASDPDREGEAISWHLASVLGLDIAKTKRLVFHEITKPVIEAAIENPSHINMDLVYSQETRRMYDRIIGFKLSSLLKQKMGAISAGRVQSATLRLVVDNDDEIKAFVPQEYWTIDVTLDLGNGKTIVVSLDKIDGKNVEIHSKEEADAILARIGKEMKIVSLTSTKKKTFPKFPFSTSTMQQEAYNRYKFSTSITQSIAQKLYEGLEIDGEHVGLITYLRTDSTRLSKEFIFGDAKPFIEKEFGKEYIGNLSNHSDSEKSKNIQDAHEGIRPTSTLRTPDMVAKYVTREEAKLYRLIYDRTIASLMAPKEEEVTTALWESNGLTFKATGNRTLFKGYTAIYGEFEDEESKKLPELDQSKDYSVLKVDPEQKFTKGPARFTEAKLVRSMEEKGIGRPSTYASTIKTLLTRKYITTKAGVITPTEEGIRTTKVLEKYFPEIVSTSYTANMETTLDKIEEGSETRLKAMNDFYYPFMEKFEEVRNAMWKDADEPTGKNCPVCGAPLVYKKSKYGRFIGCSNYPACKYVEKEPAKETGEMCPVCGKPLVVRKNRRGQEFIACSDYPKCTYIKEDENAAKKPANKKTYTEEDYVKECPSCHKGHLVIKHGKRVDFLGCTNFPKCRYIEWLPKENKDKDKKE